MTQHTAPEEKSSPVRVDEMSLSTGATSKQKAFSQN